LKQVDGRGDVGVLEVGERKGGCGAGTPRGEAWGKNNEW